MEASKSPGADVARSPRRRGPKVTKWTPARNASFREAWLRGVAIKRMAEQFECSEKAIKHQRYMLGLESRFSAASMRLHFTVDSLLYRSVSARAAGLGCSVSRYLRGLVRRDLMG